MFALLKDNACILVQYRRDQRDCFSTRVPKGLRPALMYQHQPTNQPLNRKSSSFLHRTRCNSLPFTIGMERTTCSSLQWSSERESGGFWSVRARSRNKAKFSARDKLPGAPTTKEERPPPPNNGTHTMDGGPPSSSLFRPTLFPPPSLSFLPSLCHERRGQREKDFPFFAQLSIERRGKKKKKRKRLALSLLSSHPPKSIPGNTQRRSTSLECSFPKRLPIHGDFQCGSGDWKLGKRGG